MSRYKSVEAFAADISRFINNETVNAMPDNRFYRVSKFVKRNLLPVALGGGLFFALSGGIITTSLQIKEANIQRQAALIEAERADERSETTAVAVRMFANLTGQAITEAEAGTLDFPVLLNQFWDGAVDNIYTNPAEARNKLYTLSLIHDRRQDDGAVLDTLQPIYDATEDREDFATAMGLMRYAHFSARRNDMGAARQSLDRSYKIMSKSPKRYGFALVNLRVLRAQYAEDTDFATSEFAAPSRGSRRLYFQRKSGWKPQ